ncbi:MAG: competence/damage-inducible protein A [Candidatus Marinimicrobia bacterium]|nr:competence/damage-inducible protein A [Candidatus Neomarinimicrobiota bacterium]
MGKRKSIVSLITIGDEILLGHTLDSNSNYIASRLSEIGITVRSIKVCADKREDIIGELNSAFSGGDIVIVTGGLGPTVDDITRPVLSEYFESKLIFREDLMKKIEDFYTERNIPLIEQVRVQAFFPEGAEPIENKHGTAPGMFFRKHDKLCFSTPGVPREMKGMMDDFIIPMLLRENRGSGIRYRIIRTVGIGESYAAEKIGEWKFPEVHIAYLPNYGRVDLRISTEAEDSKDADRLLKEAFEYISERLDEYIYGEDKQEFVQTIGELLKSKGWRLAVAESCTGGLLGSMITAVSGSSDYFSGGFIAYSNEVKIEQLGVPGEIIAQYGAVSEETAEEMAVCARTKIHADVGIGITGIAGPSGGTAEKPVGTTFIAVSTPVSTKVHKYEFKYDRNMNRFRAAFTALNLLFTELKTMR